MKEDIKSFSSSSWNISISDKCVTTYISDDKIPQEKKKFKFTFSTFWKILRKSAINISPFITQVKNMNKSYKKILFLHFNMEPFEHMKTLPEVNQEKLGPTSKKSILSVLHSLD